MTIFSMGSEGDGKNSPRRDTPLSGPLGGKKICVVGAGFVGTVAAAGFAKFGHEVICVEKDPARVAELSRGKVPFFERDLEELLKSSLAGGRLTFTSNLEKAVDGSKAVFLTVGTPSANGGRADISALKDIISVLSKCLSPGQIVVIKSTVPVGTAGSLKIILEQNGSGTRGVEIINNPEFLREGNAVFDFFNPHRIVIGGDSHDAIETVAHIYRMGMTRHVPIITTNNETAEMIKYASNVYLATKVGFVNELARLCDGVGVNAVEVARVMGMDPRIGQEFLNPGPGWGGSCLPKDLMEFLGLADSLGISLVIPRAVHDANQKQFDHVAQKVKDLLGTLEKKRIGVLGLTFKADTSDLRDSPSIPILKILMEKGAEIMAFDPAAGDDLAAVLPGINRVNTPYESADGSDCILILTEWSEFQLLDWKRMGDNMRTRNIVDTRNILAPELVKKYGFDYSSMGQI